MASSSSSSQAHLSKPRPEMIVHRRDMAHIPHSQRHIIKQPLMLGNNLKKKKKGKGKEPSGQTYQDGERLEFWLKGYCRGSLFA